MYDSALESRVAATFDLLKVPERFDTKFAKVSFVDYQVPFTLIKKSQYGRAIYYKADFVVWWSVPEDDTLTNRFIGTRMIIEVKGVATPVWKLKERMFHDKYPDLELRVVYKESEVFTIAEEIYATYHRPS